MPEKKDLKKRVFVSAEEDAKQKKSARKKIKEYPLAFTDPDFLLRDECRPVRLQLELLRPELELQEQNINDGIVFFGSARMPSLQHCKKLLREAKAALKADSHNQAKHKEVLRLENMEKNCHYLKEATKLARVASECPRSDFVVITGGGPSFMAAANKGACEAGKPSVALNMLLPNEQTPNRYVSPELTFQFHYFAIRKMHFLMRAKAVAAFPGGFGTMDELFELLTLMQTKKVEQIPVILFCERFWRKVINFEGLVSEGTISEKDLELFHYVETADEAWEIISDFYSLDEADPIV